MKPNNGVLVPCLGVCYPTTDAAEAAVTESHTRQLAFNPLQAPPEPWSMRQSPSRRSGPLRHQDEGRRTPATGEKHRNCCLGIFGESRLDGSDAASLEFVGADLAHG